jgi:hypothetical protein
MAGKNPKFVINAFKKNCYDKFKKIMTFIAKHESIGLTSDGLEKLKKLNTALEVQWARMEAAWDKMMTPIEDESILEVLDKLMRATGQAVDEVLENSEQFIKEKSVRIPGAGTPPAGTTSGASWTTAV